MKTPDPSLPMWDMQRNIDPAPTPKRRGAVQFLYPGLPRGRRNVRTGQTPRRIYSGEPFARLFQRQIC